MQTLYLNIVFLSLYFYQVHSKSDCIAYINHKNIRFNNTENYLDNSCAQCYWYLGDKTNYWREGSLVNRNMTYLEYRQNVYMCFYNQTKDVMNVQPLDCNVNNPFKFNQLNFEHRESDLFLSQFKSDYHMGVFQKCCLDAKFCCESVQQSENNGESENCPAKWDGWSCWHSTEPGQTQYNLCPDMHYTETDEMPADCARDYASKGCNTNGNWFTYSSIDNSTGQISLYEFVNYDKCAENPIAKQKRKESILYISGYCISLISTFIGSMIFLVYKQYRLLRIKIHLNFFMALMLTSILSIVYYSQLNNSESNQISCKTVTVLYKSSNLINYCWMLIEGIYLHQMIATMGAIQEKRKALYYYFFGWGTSPLIMIVFICVHSMQKYDDNSCWTSWSVSEVIWDILPLICIGANTLLLINVVRVLFTKLRSTPEHLRSGLKASLALIPIYGIQFLFLAIPFDPYQTCSGGLFFLKYTEIFVASLQGAMVASIFCFFNREVHLNIRRSFRSRFPKKDCTEMVTEEATVN